MKGKRLAALGSSAGSLGVLTMAIPNATYAASHISMSVWTLQLGQSFKPYVDQVIRDFNKKYPNVTVHWVDVAGNDINAKYLANFAAGTSPALANLDYGAFTEMAHEILPLNKYLTPAQRNAFPAGAIAPLTINGKIMAIPYYDAGTSYPEIYNMALLNKAGIKTPPKTLSQFYHDGLLLHKKDPNAYMAIGGAQTPGPGIASDGTFQYLPVYSKNYRKVIYNTPKAHRTWAQMKKYWNGGVWDPDSISNVNQLQLFLQGTIAQDGQGMESQLQAAWAPIKAHIKLGPPLYGPSGTFETGPAFFWVVSKQTKYPRLAAQLAMTFMSVPNQLTFSKMTQGDVGPMSKAAIKDPAFYSYFKKGQQIQKQYAEMQAKSTAHGVAAPTLPLPSTVLNQVGVILQTQFNDVLVSNKPINAALKAAQSESQAVLNKYWASKR